MTAALLYAGWLALSALGGILIALSVIAFVAHPKENS